MKHLIIASVLFKGLLGPMIALAHPGRTASDGCHYCRTRCDYWGVPWNARHCHGNLKPDAPGVEKIGPNKIRHEHDGVKHTHSLTNMPYKERTKPNSGQADKQGT